VLIFLVGKKQAMEERYLSFDSPEQTRFTYTNEVGARFRFALFRNQRDLAFLCFLDDTCQQTINIPADFALYEATRGQQGLCKPIGHGYPLFSRSDYHLWYRGAVVAEFKAASGHFVRLGEGTYATEKK